MPAKLSKEQLEARYEALSEAEEHCFLMAGDCGNDVLHDAYNWAGKKLQAESGKLLDKIREMKG